MEENNKPKWLVPVGIGCAVILCLCLLGVGGVYIFGDQLLGDLGSLGDIPGLPQDFADILTPPPADMPVEPDPFEEDPLPPQVDTPLSGAQVSDQSTFFDDFSTDALDWDVVDDGTIVLAYENQAYSFLVKEPDYLDYVWLPTLFDPATVKFDVWGPPGEQAGTLGVECRVQVEGDNYYYVEFELSFQDVFVGGYLNGEYVEFYQSGNEFNTLPLQYMNTNPDQPNTIEVTCNPDNVLVTVNGMLEQTVPVPSEYQIWETGPMTFFVYTYEDTMAGYKVFFDNVYAYP